MERFATKKTLGQHFLNDASIAGKIALAGEISQGETVLEIGPGTGALTTELLKVGARVVAVEADERAISVLSERFRDAIDEGMLTIVHGDIREIAFTDLGLVHGTFKIIANIPYYISGYLFRKALGEAVKPSMVVFLVQKEVAERIAREKKESLLSIGIKAYGDPEYVFTVKRGSFTPPPKVDSAVIRIRNISGDRIKGIDDDTFFDIVRHGFAARRKQLFGALKNTFGVEATTAAFTAANIPLNARGEDLTISTWIELAHALILSTKSQ